MHIFYDMQTFCTLFILHLLTTTSFSSNVIKTYQTQVNKIHKANPDMIQYC